MPRFESLNAYEVTLEGDNETTVTRTVQSDETFDISSLVDSGISGSLSQLDRDVDSGNLIDAGATTGSMTVSAPTSQRCVINAAAIHDGSGQGGEQNITGVNVTDGSEVFSTTPLLDMQYASAQKSTIIIVDPNDGAVSVDVDYQINIRDSSQRSWKAHVVLYG